MGSPQPPVPYPSSAVTPTATPGCFHIDDFIVDEHDQDLVFAEDRPRQNRSAPRRIFPIFVPPIQSRELTKPNAPATPTPATSLTDPTPRTPTITASPTQPTPNPKNLPPNPKNPSSDNNPHHRSTPSWNTPSFPILRILVQTTPIGTKRRGITAHQRKSAQSAVQTTPHPSPHTPVSQKHFPK